jgi:cardiolipin synthase A/B
MRSSVTLRQARPVRPRVDTAMYPPHPLIDAVARLASSLPGDVVDRVAQVISACEPAEVRSRIADAVPHAHHRSLALGFVETWLVGAPDVTPAEIAIALRTVAHLARLRRNEPSVEVVWTGPHGDAAPCRHTEQAILQVLNSARSRLLLVSYAVYSIPNIQEAVVRAARRGVKITVVVETPDRLEGHGTYSTLQALGEDVAGCSTVYLWPHEKRPKDPSGKVGILHVKCVVADGRWLFLSSANLTEYAFTINMELGLLVTGGHLPVQVEAHFDRLVGTGILVPI